MRYPTSTTYRTAMYLHHVKYQHTFTARDIMNAAHDAQSWYLDHLSPSVLAERDAIIERHGFTDTTWQEVLRDSHSFYFVPTDEMTACNREMRALMSRQFIINSIMYAEGHFTSHISNARKRGVLIRDDNTSPYVYHINPQYVNNPNFPTV